MFNIFSSFKKHNDKLFFKTDMHCHLVPGVDDGSKDSEMSVYLIKGLAEMGIEHIITTPHVTAHTFENDKSTIARPLAELRKELSEEGIGIRLDQSAEYRIDDFYLNKVLKPCDFMPMPNNHILLESNWLQEPLNLEDIVYETSCKGFQVIFAHPERYKYLNDNYERYEEFHEHNMMFQTNLLSFAGYYGRIPQETAFWLLEHGLVDFIGTDMHNPKFLAAIQEFLKSKTYKKMLDKVEKSDIKNDTAFL